VNKRPPRNGEKIAKQQNTLLVDGNALFKVGYFPYFYLNIDIYNKKYL
jgi:hypothetical protein